MATAKQRTVRNQRIKERAERRREELWPELDENRIWNRGRSHGFSTVPRTLTLVGTIADSMAEKNKRVSTTYIGLWCRVWDTGVVVIENEYEVATEAGFTGERRIYTWRDRIKQLAALGFIDVKAGPKGPHQFILIFNPYQVLYDHSKTGGIQSHLWLALVERAEEIGARDIDKYEEALKAKDEPPKKRRRKSPAKTKEKS